MGFEAENEDACANFADWQVDEDMMKVANPARSSCIACPVHRGEEVSAEVIDGLQSVVFDEAENRPTRRRAFPAWCLAGRRSIPATASARTSGETGLYLYMTTNP